MRERGYGVEDVEVQELGEVMEFRHLERGDLKRNSKGLWTSTLIYNFITWTKIWIHVERGAQQYFKYDYFYEEYICV